MIAVLTGLLLATSAGLNAYIPLLALGLLARFTSLITLPEGWAWIESTPALSIIGVLFVCETLVDKLPAFDTVNDVLQSAIRPASGGIVLSAGVTSSTWRVENPEVFTDVSRVWPFLLGLVIALIPHLAKMMIRPIFNTVTGGFGAPVLSALEDLSAAMIAVLAVIVPLIGLTLLCLIVWIVVARTRRARSSRKNRALASNDHPEYG